METKHFKNLAPFRPIFGKNPAKIWPQICPAANIFIWPLLSFAVEESASWEHWELCCFSFPPHVGHNMLPCRASFSRLIYKDDQFNLTDILVVTHLFVT